MNAHTYVPFAAIREDALAGPILHIFGEIDAANAPAFEAAVREVEAGDVLTIDLADCRYLDSSGIAVLVRTHKRLGQRLRLLIRRDSMVFRIMQITSLDRVFTIVSALQSRAELKQKRLMDVISADRPPAASF
jgi:anti-anti-sigma factor